MLEMLILPGPPVAGDQSGICAVRLSFRHWVPSRLSTAPVRLNWEREGKIHMLTIVIIIITYKTRYFNQLLSCTHFIISSSFHLCFIFPLPSLSPPSLRLPYPLPLPLPPFPLSLPYPIPPTTQTLTSITCNGYCMIKRRNKCKGKTKAVRRPTYLFTFQLRMDAYRNTTTTFLWNKTEFQVEHKQAKYRTGGRNIFSIFATLMNCWAFDSEQKGLNF